MFANSYHTLKRLNEDCYINNIFYYHKTNLIRAPLEAAITLYVSEFYILFTNIFNNTTSSSLAQSINTKQMIIIILIPLIYALFLCTFYSVYLIKKINKYFINNESLENLKYEIIDNVFAKCAFKIHIVGTFSYLLSAFLLTYCYYIVCNDVLIINSHFFVKLIAIVTFGLISGFLWNIMGYCSDRSIDWSRVYKKHHLVLQKTLKFQKFKYYYAHRVINIIILLLYILLSMIAFLFIDENTINSNNWEFMYLLITIFITLITLYSKQMYSLYFNENKKKNTIFHTFKSLK